MQTLGSFIDKKKLVRQTVIDEKSVFYIFSLVIKEEYGLRGLQSIKPAFLRDRKIFVKIAGSLWEDEISQNKGQLIKKVNLQLGGDEIIDFVTAN